MRMKVILVWLASLVGTGAHGLTDTAGRWDYAYSLGVRSLPVGLGLWGEVGYSRLLWGESPSALNPFYGYIRPKLSAQTSGVVNRTDLGIDIALWAPVLIEVTYGLDHRRADFAAFDCTQLQCRGLVVRTKVALKLSAGTGPYFLLWDSLMESVRGPKGSDLGFGDQYWSLAGRRPKDLLLNTELTLGRAVSDHLKLGVQGSLAAFQASGERSKTVLGFAAIRNGRQRIFVGAGLYQSSRSPAGFTTAFGLRWTDGDSFSIR